MSSFTSTQMMVLLLVAVVVIAVAYWFFRGASIYSAPVGPAQSPGQTPQSVGQLIDRYNVVVKNTQFTDAILRPQRDALEKSLPAAFLSIVPSLNDGMRAGAGVVLNEVERIIAAPMDPAAQRSLASEHGNAISALKAKSDAGLNKAIDALKRLGPQPVAIPR